MGSSLPAKKKVPERPSWTGYWLLTSRPFADGEWVRRWTALKEELRLKIPR